MQRSLVASQVPRWGVDGGYSSEASIWHFEPTCVFGAGFKGDMWQCESRQTYSFNGTTHRVSLSPIHGAIRHSSGSYPALTAFERAY